ncbi:UBN2_3 domain-containing protein [Cucumis melo var. makuwa]|uniref:UBN2_3 domain-containing protein n=1 Tax=Cucumis melo var. makuwa TaxID=1194695 RepID=A0A5D3CUZ0_CUCMM|nr:UBN2_3 domain-containing protein [Cucumis melo var. makuwa]
MPSHPLTLVIIPMLGILKFTQHEVGESTTHSDPNVQASSSSSGIAQQQLKGLRKQIAAIETTIGTTSNTPVSMLACRYYMLQQPKIFGTWQEMDLCKEIVWNCSSDGIQHSRIEEIDRIYNFLAGPHSKFDIDRTSAMSILPTPVVDFAAFIVKTPDHDRKRIVENLPHL